MTIPDAASFGTAAASHPEESAPGDSGETSPWPLKPFRAGARRMAAHPELHPASLVAASPNHAGSAGTGPGARPTADPEPAPLPATPVRRHVADGRRSAPR